MLVYLLVALEALACFMLIFILIIILRGGRPVFGKKRDIAEFVGYTLSLSSSEFNSPSMVFIVRLFSLRNPFAVEVMIGDKYTPLALQLSLPWLFSFRFFIEGSAIVPLKELKALEKRIAEGS